MPDSGHFKLFRSAGIVGIAVVISRVLGLVREMVLAYLFPAKTDLDAFYAAFRIPNLLRDLFAESVLGNAFVPTFTDAEVKSGEDTAWRLANLVFNTTAVILSILTFIGIVLAPFIFDFIFMGKGFDTSLPPEESFGFTDKRELAVYLTRIMFPFLIMVSMAAIAMGLLNSKRRFGVPALAPSFFNIGSVAIGIWGYHVAPKLGQHPSVGMAVGVLAGGALQFIIQVPSMYRVGFRYKPILKFNDPYLLQMMRLVGPAIIGTAAVEVNVLVNSFFASQGEGWVTWLTQAFRIMYFPIGALGVAISTAALPALSSAVARNFMDEYRATFSYALKLIFILALPASAGLIALNRPIVSLIFEHGRFSSYDTTKVASALFYYAFGLCGYSGVKLVTGGFYALKDVKTPVIVSLFTVGINILLNYIFIFRLGFDHRSLAVSTACSITINFLLILGLLWKRVGGIEWRDTVSVFIRSIVASAGMGVLAGFVYEYVLNLMRSSASLFISIIISVPALHLLYRMLGIREFDQILTVILRKIRR